MSTKKFSSVYLLVILLTGALIVAPAVTVAGMSSSNARLDDQTATVETTYTIEFTSDVSEDVEKVEIAFPTGFDVSGAALESKASIGAGSLSVGGQVLTYTLNSKEDLDTDAVDLVVSGIVNHSTAGNYSLSLQTIDEFGAKVDESSIPVTITEIPDHFAVSSGTKTAGESFTVTLTAENASNTKISGYKGTHLIAFSSSGEGTIPSFIELDFTGGDVTTSANFILTNATQEPTITAEDSALGFSGTSDKYTVNPNILDHFEITGLPTTSVTAGEAFSSDVTVTAYDAYGNVKTDYSPSDTGDVSWSSTDSSADYPVDGDYSTGVGGQFTDGVATFSGSLFALKTVDTVDGGQTLTIEDDNVTNPSSTATVSKETGIIPVDPAAANSISTLSKSKDQITANGVDFTKLTAEVTDEYGNLATGYTDAVTFEASLGDLYEVDSNFSDGTATAKLSSTELGTSDVVVSSGSFENSTTVTLGNTVYVDGDVGDDDNSGTENRPYASIEYAVNNASVGQTIVVKPYTASTYAPSSSLVLDKAGLTLKASGSDRVEIDVSSTTISNQANIDIKADDVTVDGFEVDVGAQNEDHLKIVAAGTLPLSGIVIKNNKFVADSSHSRTALAVTDGNVSEVTIKDNVMESVGIGIWVGGGNSYFTISGNTITGSDAYSSNGGIVLGTPAEVSYITIADNEISNGGDGIEFAPYGSPTYDEITIENNVIDGAGDNAVSIEAPNTTTITNLSIVRNDLINSGADGVEVAAWDSTNSISENNIEGNTTNGVENTTTKTVDVTENWWGSTDKPVEGDGEDYYENPGEILVDPWLDAAYPDGEPTSAVPTAFYMDIEQGWQMISLKREPVVEEATSVFGGRAGSVFYWDASAGEYVAGDDANPIDPFKGMWLYSSNAVKDDPTTPTNEGYDLGDGYDVEGDSTLTFVEGDGDGTWNQIGVPFNVNWNQVTFTYDGSTKSPMDAESAGWITDQVQYYDTADDEYKVAAGVSEGSDVGLLKADTGYWLKVNADLSVSDLVMNVPFEPGPTPSASSAALQKLAAQVPTATPPAPPAAPQEAANDLKATAAMSNGTVTFEVAGADVNGLNVQVFSANGEEIFSSSASGNSLTWNANVSNGIYLYGVSAKVNGQVTPLGIQKLLVLQ